MSKCQRDVCIQILWPGLNIVNAIREKRILRMFLWCCWYSGWRLQDSVKKGLFAAIGVDGNPSVINILWQNIFHCLFFSFLVDIDSHVAPEK